MWLVALGPEPEWSTPWRALDIRAVLSARQNPRHAEHPGSGSRVVPRDPVSQRAGGLRNGCSPSAISTPRVARCWRGLALLIVVEGWCVDRIVEVPRPMRPWHDPRGCNGSGSSDRGGVPQRGPQYRGVVGGYRTVNGYSGYLPPHFTPLRRAIGDMIPNALDEYRRDGDLYVIVRPWALDRHRALGGHTSRRRASLRRRGQPGVPAAAAAARSPVLALSARISRFCAKFWSPTAARSPCA